MDDEFPPTNYAYGVRVGGGGEGQGNGYARGGDRSSSGTTTGQALLAGARGERSRDVEMGSESYELSEAGAAGQRLVR